MNVKAAPHSSLWSRHDVQPSGRVLVTCSACGATMMRGERGRVLRAWTRSECTRLGSVGS